MQDMLTDEFKHELNGYLMSQGEKLLAHQRSIASSSYNSVTGNLIKALSARPQTGIETGGVGVEVNYPVYIRFLDMKKRRSAGGKIVRKKHYSQIYNKYVYGYLKSDIWKKLNRLIPAQMIRAIESNIKSVK
jgi:hypothetical protein